MTMTYWQQLKHPEWQKKRLEALNLAGFSCSVCGTDNETLHVHHKQYIKGRKAWEYDLENFDVLCEECHSQAHELMAWIKNAIASVPTPLVSDVYDLLSGWLSWDQGSHTNASGIFDRRVYEAGRLAGVVQRTINCTAIVDITEQIEKQIGNDDLIIKISNVKKGAAV